MGKGPFIGGVYYEEFGNYYISKFTFHHQDFMSVEQAYQYMKCDQDKVLQSIILTELNGNKLWKYGRSLSKLPSGWNSKRQDLLFELNYAKITQNQELKNKLLLTKEEVVIFKENDIVDEMDIINKVNLEKIRSII